MAQKRKKNNKKWLYWILIVILFVVAAIVCYLVWDNYFRDKKENAPEEEQSLVEEGDTEKVEEQIVVEKEKVVLYEGEDPNSKDDLTGVVTYAGVNGDNLMIRVNIDQYLEDGSCELSLWRDGASMYTGKARIVNSVTTATCEGFNVPTSGLSEGNYKIVIKLSSGDKVGTINGETKI